MHKILTEFKIDLKTLLFRWLGVVAPLTDNCWKGKKNETHGKDKACNLSLFNVAQEFAYMKQLLSVSYWLNDKKLRPFALVLCIINHNHLHCHHLDGVIRYGGLEGPLLQNLCAARYIQIHNVITVYSVFSINVSI